MVVHNPGAPQGQRGQCAAVGAGAGAHASLALDCAAPCEPPSLEYSLRWLHNISARVQLFWVELKQIRDAGLISGAAAEGACVDVRAVRPHAGMPLGLTMAVSTEP